MSSVSSVPRIAFATCFAFSDGSPDDQDAAALAEADFRVWDDESVDWKAYDRVVLRSVWDYTWRHDEFLAWCRAVGPQRLRNPPELVAFNADKRYLGALSAPTVPTTFVSPGDSVPPLAGEVVVKPNVSAGARNTGRFSPGLHEQAIELIERICRSGRVALVQPYLSDISEHGETAVVFVAGEVLHVLHKRPILRGEGIAPVADGPLRVAAAMLEEDLVGPGIADDAQLSLAHAVHDELAARFGVPLYARVDIVPGPDGTPVLIELEAIEPRLYLNETRGAAERFARAVRESR